MIVVPPPPPPSSNSSTTPVSALLPLGDAPPSLRATPIGAILQGQVVSNAPGALVVQTVQGQLSLAVTLTGLRVGHNITLTLQPGGTNGQLLIQSDRPPSQATTAISDVLPKLQSAAQPLKPGTIVQSIVIQAPPPVSSEALPPPPNLTPPSVTATNPAAPSSPPITGAPNLQSTAFGQTGAALPSALAAGTPTTLQPALQAAPLPGATPLVPQPQAAQPFLTSSPQTSQTAGSPGASTPPLAGTQPLLVPPGTVQSAPAPSSALVQAGSTAATTASPMVERQASIPPALAPPAATASASSPIPSPISPTAIPTTAAPPSGNAAFGTPAVLLGAHNGDRIPLRVVSLIPAGAPLPEPVGPTVTQSFSVSPTPTVSATTAPRLAAGNFVAVVVGTSANGSAIVNTGGTLLTLQGLSAPVASAVVLSAAAPKPPVTVPQTLANPTLSAVLPGVAELIGAANATGGAAQAAMQAIIPRLGPHMAANMIFFMRALRTGDLNDLLGKDARIAIERSGRANSVKRATADLEQIARANDSGNEWSVYPIPLGVGGQRIEPIRLYVRQAEDDASGQKSDGKAKPTRFLIDLDLTKLGRIQLDGLARLPKLELLVRSEAPLDPSLQQPLKRLFADVTSARGIQGAMNFQVAPPIDPMVAVPTKIRSGIVV